MDYMGKWGFCDRETCPQATKVGDQRIQCDLLNTQTFRCQCHRIFCQFFFCIIRNHNPTNEANDANDGSVRDGRHPQALCLPLQVQGGRLQRVHNSEGFNVLVLNSSQQTRQFLLKQLLSVYNAYSDTALWVKQCNYKRSEVCKSLQK